MARLTRDGLQAPRWQLVKQTVKKYSILFWFCIAVATVFAGLALYLLLASKEGAWIAGVIAFGFGYLALQAPRQPYAEESETEAGLGGVKTRTVGGPLAGDRDPTAAPTKQADPDGSAPDDEPVSGAEAEPPEQPQGPEPAQE